MKIIETKSDKQQAIIITNMENKRKIENDEEACAGHPGRTKENERKLSATSLLVMCRRGTIALNSIS